MPLKNQESWVETKNCVAATICLLFFEIYKKVFSLQWASYSPNALPTMVHGQTFRIITLHPLSATRGKQWTALYVWVLITVTSTQQRQKYMKKGKQWSTKHYTKN